MKLPCINCVCLPMCKHKQVRVMFRQCTLIETFWVDSIDKSFNHTVAADIIKVANIFNEVLDRHFIPCFTGEGIDITKTIGVVDIGSNYNDNLNSDRIRKTYRIFKTTFDIDMLDTPRVKKLLHPIVKEIKHGY